MDLDIHNNNGVYEYKIHRKNAITNVQVKPHSGHDPKVLRGIFTGFLHRAYTVCEGQHREEEVDFLIRCFAENGYRYDELHSIVRQFKKKRETNNIQQLPEQEQDRIGYYLFSLSIYVQWVLYITYTSDGDFLNSV